MRGDRFTAKERAYLMSLPAVADVTAQRIRYSDQFRVECMVRYAAGESPTALFREAGLDPELIGYKRIERCIARWKRGAKGLRGGVPSRRPGRPARQRDDWAGAGRAEGLEDAGGAGGVGGVDGADAAGAAGVPGVSTASGGVPGNAGVAAMAGLSGGDLRTGVAGAVRVSGGAAGGAEEADGMARFPGVEDATTSEVLMAGGGQSLSAAAESQLGADSRDMLIAQQALRIDELERLVRKLMR